MRGNIEFVFGPINLTWTEICNGLKEHAELASKAGITLGEAEAALDILRSGHSASPDPGYSDKRSALN